MGLFEGAQKLAQNAAVAATIALGLAGCKGPEQRSTMDFDRGAPTPGHVHRDRSAVENATAPRIDRTKAMAEELLAQPTAEARVKAMADHLANGGDRQAVQLALRRLAADPSGINPTKGFADVVNAGWGHSSVGPYVVQALAHHPYPNRCLGRLGEEKLLTAAQTYPNANMSGRANQRVDHHLGFHVEEANPAFAAKLAAAEKLGRQPR